MRKTKTNFAAEMTAGLVRVVVFLGFLAMFHDLIFGINVIIAGLLLGILSVLKQVYDRIDSE